MSQEDYSQGLPSGGDTFTATNSTKFNIRSRSTKFLKKAVSRTGHSIAMISCLVMPKPDIDRFSRLTKGPKLDTELDTAYQPTSYQPTSYRPPSRLATSKQSPRNTGHTSSPHSVNPVSTISSNTAESPQERTNDGIHGPATSILGETLPSILDVVNSTTEQQVSSRDDFSIEEEQRTEILPEDDSSSIESEMTDGDISSSEGSVASTKPYMDGASSNNDIFVLRRGLGAMATASKSRVTFAPHPTQDSGLSRFGRIFSRNHKSHSQPSFINSHDTTDQHEMTYELTNIRNQTASGSRVTLGAGVSDAGAKNAWRWWRKRSQLGGVHVTVDRETSVI